MKRRQFSFHFSLPQPELRFDWRAWLPSRGNVLFTLVMIAVLLWAQSAGAVSQFTTRNSQLAASTGTIAYQGRLADSSGNPLTQTLNMSFRLYNASTGGAPLWTEQWTGSNGVQVSDGLFNVMLGSLTPIPQSVITGNSTLFLGITVGTDDEMSPRVQLGSVPFAVQALTVPDGSITAAKLAGDVSLVPPTGSITTTMLADGAVTTAKLATVPQKIDCFPPPSQCCFGQATSGIWSNDLFSCTFTVATAGIAYMSLQGHQATSGGPCSFSIFFDGVNINTGPRNNPSHTYTTAWHPSHMADTVNVTAGTHTISARMQGVGSGECLLHDPDINGLFVPTR